MICDSLQGIALPRLKYFHLFFNQISCCLGEVSLATAAWVAVGEIFLWNNPADREALGLSREGGEPLNKVAVATSYPISHPIPSHAFHFWKILQALRNTVGQNPALILQHRR